MKEQNRKRQSRGRLALLLLLLALLLLTGCTSPADEDAEDGRLQIVTTIFPPYDFVRQIAGDTVDLTMLIAPGAEVHYFEPSPADMIAVARCDMFICVGGESDAWVEELLASVDTSSITVVRLIDMTDLVEEEVVSGMEVHEEHDHAAAATPEAGPEQEEEAEYDEHVWTSPRNAMLIVEQLCELLCAAAPQQAQLYQDQAAAYLAQLTQLDDAFAQVVAQAQRHTIIFGDRFPFRYFVEEYGLDYYAAFPGCAAQTEPSAATIAFLIDKVREEQIPVVFRNELSPGNEAETIAADTGAQVRTFYACHNIGRDDLAAGEDYLSLMWKNVDSLKEALN